MQNQQANPYDMQSHLKSALDAQAHQYALTADNREDFQQWQQDFRPALSDVLKITNRIPADVPKRPWLHP